MTRRSFLQQAGSGLAAGAALGAAPFVHAQSQPNVVWRLASSFPKSLDTVFGGAEFIAARVAAATGGRFQIKVFAAGELAPAFGVVDAVQGKAVDCAHTAPYYFFGKDPTFAFACAVPFGLSARQQAAWQLHGGGRELMREFYAAYDIVNFGAGNSGAQMGGWFRKELKTVADLKGLKFRVGGFAGAVLSKLGVVPQQIAAGDIYPALEKGTIDAAEWIGPYDDEKLGLHKVAKNYYYPGWWEGGTEFELFVNAEAWKALTPEYKAILEAACAEAGQNMLARYDAVSPPALKRLVAQGVKLQPFPAEIAAASYKAAQEVFEETAAANPRFAKVLGPWRKFRDEQIQWHSVAQARFDSVVAQAARAGAR